MPRNTQYALIGKCYAESADGWSCNSVTCRAERTLLLPRDNPVGFLAALALEKPDALEEKYIAKIHPKSKHPFDKSTIEQFIERQKKWHSN